MKFSAPHPSERKTAAEMEQKIAPAQNRRPDKTLGVGRGRVGGDCGGEEDSDDDGNHDDDDDDDDNHDDDDDDGAIDDDFNVDYDTWSHGGGASHAGR